MVIVRFAATGFGILPNIQIFILYNKNITNIEGVSMKTFK